MGGETKPKTAEEILANNIDGLKEFIQDEEIFSFYREVILECMKETARTVAQQVRQECAEEAKAYFEITPIITTGNTLKILDNGDIDIGDAYKNKAAVDKESILSIDIEQFIK